MREYGPSAFVEGEVDGGGKNAEVRTLRRDDYL